VPFNCDLLQTPATVSRDSTHELVLAGDDPKATRIVLQPGVDVIAQGWREAAARDLLYDLAVVGIDTVNDGSIVEVRSGPTGGTTPPAVDATPRDDLAEVAKSELQARTLPVQSNQW